jgi:hypothetical protein
MMATPLAGGSRIPHGTGPNTAATAVTQSRSHAERDQPGKDLSLSIRVSKIHFIPVVFVALAQKSW